MIGTLATAALSIPAPLVTTSYESIATSLVGSGGTSSIVFDLASVSGYKHLQLRCSMKASTGADLNMRFNTDTASASNYYTHILRGYGSNPASAEAYAISIPTNINGTNFGAAVIDILDYTSTSKNKTIRSLTGYDNNGSGEVGLWSMLWFKTPEAINKITLTPSTGTISEFSSIALYGIKD